MSNYNLSFCDDYSYPHEIKNIFRKFLDSLVLKKVISVILSGSASRGEISYIYNESNLKLYSDLEFFVIVKNTIKKNEINFLNKKFRELEFYLNKQTKFTHIDVSFLKLGEIRKLPPKFQFFETKKTGKTLYGKDLKFLFPDKVNIKYINEFSLGRLWSLILYFPQNILSSENTKEEEKDYKYILSRSMFDIPLCILAHEGHFIPGFKSRIDFLVNNYNRIQFMNFFPFWFISFLKECWQYKVEFIIRHDLIDMYEKVLVCYDSLTRFILSKTINDTIKEKNINKQLIINSSSIYEPSLRRKAFELMLLLRNIDKMNIMDGVKWFFVHKNSLMILFLINMNYAMFNYLKGDRICNVYLKHAEDCLLELDFRLKKIRGNKFCDRWLNLRKKYVDFLIFFYRCFEIKKDYLHFVIKL